MADDTEETLHIDGTFEDGSYMTECGTYPLTHPWAVFDEEQQRNLVWGLPFRWMAVVCRWAIRLWRKL
jgi:hypothetical protein